ncbi:hypothetical protein GGI09_003939 [Coemansia sp. S100]|nr:hypothetical protein LPJ71_000333 [Coemansia sp. S17]KAJ2097240.1 hypothetical protein GGI09_003939 [Coemansia sp. S100]KAJ2106976.1 hypothetical protein GGI16_001716 [Coemansia sp. S142-1]
MVHAKKYNKTSVPGNRVLPGNEVPDLPLPPGYEWSKVEHCRTIRKSLELFCRLFLLREAIEWCVKYLTDIAFEASRMFELHLKRHCEEYGMPVTEINNAYLRQCFLGVRGRFRGEFEDEIAATIKTYKSAYNPPHGYSRPDTPKRAVSGIMNYLIDQYLTNLNTHANTTLPIIIRRFIALWLNKKKGVPLYLAERRATSVFKKLNDPKSSCNPVDWQSFGAPLAFVTSLEDKLHMIFLFNHFVERLGGKAVLLVPLFSARTKFLTIDSHGLFELLRDFSLLPAGVKLLEDFQVNRTSYWRKFFRIKPKLLRHPGEHIVGNRSYFNMMFRTDGVNAHLITYQWNVVPKKLNTNTDVNTDAAAAEP